MEQSRSGRLKARSWNWRSLLVSTGALGYWGSILGQIGWNTAGAMTRTDSAWDVDQELPASAVNLCVDQALAQKQVDGYCSAALTPYAGLALVLGVLTLWWNPRLRHRVEGRGGRLVGLDEYYKIQIFVLVMRFVAWAWLQDPSTSGVDPGIFPAIHIFSVVFTILVSILRPACLCFDCANYGLVGDRIQACCSVQHHSTGLVAGKPGASSSASTKRADWACETARKPTGLANTNRFPGIPN